MRENSEASTHFCSVAFRDLRLTSPTVRISCSSSVMRLLSFEHRKGIVRPMDSYYALGATSVPVRKSRLVTAVRFSMCLQFSIHLCGFTRNFTPHFWYILGQFPNFPIQNPNGAVRFCIRPLLYLTPPHHQNPPKPSRETGKSIAPVSRQKSRLEVGHPTVQVGSANFQRYFFPLDGDGGVLIQSFPQHSSMCQKLCTAIGYFDEVHKCEKIFARIQ